MNIVELTMSLIRIIGIEEDIHVNVVGRLFRFQNGLSIMDCSSACLI